MSLKKGAILATITLFITAPTVNGHTWVEYLYQIGPTGGFTGDAGYPIGYVPRQAGVSDDVHQNKILDTSTNPPVCKPLSSSDFTKYPSLNAPAGSYIAMQYQENGHVTQPDLTLRPYRGGNVYVYGTLEHQDSDGINDVLNAWTADGQGGNKKGKLLATHYFDDGQCFQDAPGNPIATERKAKYGVDQLFCQTDLQLPADLPTQGTYTLMWVWDWPRIITNSQNVTEIYTTCAQINLNGTAKQASVKFAANDNIASAGIPSQLHELIEATTLGIGTNSPPAPTNLGESTSQSATTTSALSTTTPVSSATSAPTTPAASISTGNSGMKTVTVTAEPHTVTQYNTVFVGGGPDSASESSTATETASIPAASTPAISFPTSIVPVTSVQGFLKARAARVTGQARRAYYY